MRTFITSLMLALSASSSAMAQWTVTVEGGIHADRLARPERTLTDDGNGNTFTSPGEAPVIGLRGTFWARPHLGVDFGLAGSQNRSWWGTARVDSKLIKRTVFVSAAGLWRPLYSPQHLDVQLGGGPALIVHRGTGQSLLARQTDVGFMATAGASWRLSRHMRLGLDVQNYRFRSDWLRAGFQRADGSYPYPAIVTPRSEWLVLPVLRITP